VSWGGGEVAVIRAGETPEGGFDLEVPAGSLEPAWRALVEEARRRGGGAVGRRAAEILRIEAGVPRWGSEIDGTRFPTECGLEAAVSYEKGCFIGQEVIARIRTYGHLNRRLMAVRFRRAPEARPGEKLFRDGAEAGLVTSAASLRGTGAPWPSPPSAGAPGSRDGGSPRGPGWRGGEVLKLRPWCEFRMA